MSTRSFLARDLIPVVVSTVMCVVFFAAFMPNGSYFWQAARDAVSPGRSRAEVAVALDARIREAEARALAAVDACSAQFAQFVDQRSAGAALFSRSLVSAYGHWRAVKAMLPLTNANGHRQYVAQQFGHHIFTPDELSAQTSKAIEDCLRDLAGIENDLAVALRREIDAESQAALDIVEGAAGVSHAMDTIVDAARRDGAKAAGQLVVAEVAAQVASQVVARLAAMGYGALNGWYSLGVGFVVGLVVDVVWQWVDDPAADIERQTAAALRQLGADGSAALRAELTALVMERRAQWDRVAAEMLP